MRILSEEEVKEFSKKGKVFINYPLLPNEKEEVEKLLRERFDWEVDLVFTRSEIEEYYFDWLKDEYGLPEDVLDCFDVNALISKELERGWLNLTWFEIDGYAVPIYWFSVSNRPKT